MELNYQQNNNWFYYFLLAICLGVLVVLSSCSCEYHLSKAEKKCGSHVKKDTIIVHDTVITPRILHDTTFSFSYDTVRFTKERLTVKYFYNTKDSTVYLQGECASDTIYKEIKVPYESKIYEFDYFAKYKWYILIPILLLFILVVVKYILKK